MHEESAYVAMILVRSSLLSMSTGNAIVSANASADLSAFAYACGENISVMETLEGMGVQLMFAE